MKLSVVAARLGMPVDDLTFQRNPKFQRKKAWPASLADYALADLVRSSIDKEKSVASQAKDNRKAIKAFFGQEADQLPGFTDNDRSASDYGTKEREGWEELCALVATFAAVDVVVAWSVNRLGRTRPRACISCGCATSTTCAFRGQGLRGRGAQGQGRQRRPVRPAR